jgi:hypothetical protein
VTESQLERDVIQYLRYKGYFVRQTHSGLRKPVKSGTLDLAFAKAKFWGYIELKSDDGALSDKQIEEISDIYRHGGKPIVARSLQDVMDAGL